MFLKGEAHYGSSENWQIHIRTPKGKANNTRTISSSIGGYKQVYFQMGDRINSETENEAKDYLVDLLAS